MKKLTIILLFSVMTTGTYAQGLFWGAKAGLNGASMSNAKMSLEDVGTINYGGFKPSFHIGAFMEYQFSSKWAIQPELVYSRQGGFDKIGDVKLWYRSNYINVPILAKWYAVPGKFSIDFGPQVGFSLRHDIKAKTGGVTATEKIDNSELNTIDFAVAAGVTYYFTQMIGVNARYNLSLTDIAKENDGDAIRNQVFQLGINFRF